MNRFLVINPRSGDGSPTAAELAAEARNRGISVHVLAEGDDLAEVVRAADADVIGMAGGDGSLGLVAAITVERDLPFVCVPFGTRNHFARDLGLDRADPIGALAAFEQGVERSVDLARVNGRGFVNNASLGIYADLVEEREHHRRRGVALARLRALARTVRNREATHLTIDGDAAEVRVLVIANNAYTLSGVEMGSRERLDEGRLHVYRAERLLPGGWTELPARSSLRVESPQPRLTVALDGEPVELVTPLDFASEPGALRVLVPNG
jgi:diacylglycerol kinase family enzyme